MARGCDVTPCARMDADLRKFTLYCDCIAKNHGQFHHGEISPITTVHASGPATKQSKAALTSQNMQCLVISPAFQLHLYVAMSF